MRALSDPDAFLPGDVGVLEALSRLGAVPGGTGGTGAAVRARASGAGASRAAASRAAAALAENWRPWRSYAVHHLWACLEPPATAEPATATAPEHDRQQKGQP
jgi:AraC family transcriptional regulator of adaptative response / DNA-3-methyladenine glycosylase II